MNSATSFLRYLLLAFIASAAFYPVIASAQNTPQTEDDSVMVVSIEGKLETAPAGTENWTTARVDQKLRPGDRIRTGEASRALLRSAASGDLVVRGASLQTIYAPRAGSSRPVFELARGFFYFFTRGQPMEIDFFNRLASAASRQTEFLVQVDDDGIKITVFDGTVDLTNAQGGVNIQPGEQGVATLPGLVPTKSVALAATNLIQWVLYYPGVLDVDELPWDAAAQDAVGGSLAAYRDGDLVNALNLYPAGRVPVTDAEKIYRAALWLVVGEGERAKEILDTLAQSSEFSLAVRKLIAAVRNDLVPDAAAPQSASAWLAQSFYQQSRLDLEGALAAAQAATVVAPEFGFAWARVAELEFSFGRIDRAMEALDKALTRSPRHAAALALKGFLLAAQNKIPAAIRQFDEAIAVDGALGEAWLGRGLSRIRRGDARGGREDLRTAAALEPNRAVFRSYLAKALSDSGRTKLADHELELSARIDPNDPTVWLYGALHNQQQNRINEAIRRLEHAQDLNTNRAVYRSAMLLDQDRAVRSANLAALYYDAGMTDVSVREASRAVSSDYANYSAHLFLANSYERLRDPKQINLRYETPAFAEYLIANLLAPVGAGTLSPAVSQQEYSKLFERDRFGVSSRTEYQSGGNWFEEGAQFGTFGNSSYSIEGLYRSDRGQRQNNDLEQRQFSAQIKQQLTAHDSIYLQAIDYRAEGGDLTPYYDQDQANPRFGSLETQEPILLAGYHREWSPGHHTLFLGARLDDNFSVHDPSQPLNVVQLRPDGIVSGIRFGEANENYRSRLTLYSGELQHILQESKWAAIAGVRVQSGRFDTTAAQNQFRYDTNNGNFPPSPPIIFDDRQQVHSDFQRVTAYAYPSWNVTESLKLIGGLTYDYLVYPENFRFAPLVDDEQKVSRLSPKGGLIWTPARQTTVRLAYAQSLGGAGIDQSYQIEPSQVAGINQSFRSIIPDALYGANAGARLESRVISIEHKFTPKTYAALRLEQLLSSVERHLGSVEQTNTDVLSVGRAGQLREDLDFDERSASLNLDQLVGAEWAFGFSYRYSRARLEDKSPNIPPGLDNDGTIADERGHFSSDLHRMTLHAIYNHRSGWFARGETVWMAQDNSGLLSSERGDDFWQFNLLTGYRFWQRRVEVSVGVLNIGGRDYRLEPLTLYNELPRERTFVARMNFKF